MTPDACSSVRTWRVGAADELGGRADGGQRIAKLVREDRQELVLAAVGLLELQRALGDAALELLIQLLRAGGSCGGARRTP